jgi:hypothetical protein
VPFVYLLGVLALIVNALITDTFLTSVVFGVVLAGVPMYYLLVPRATRPTSA